MPVHQPLTAGETCQNVVISQTDGDDPVESSWVNLQDHHRIIQGRQVASNAAICVDHQRAKSIHLDLAIIQSTPTGDGAGV